MTLNEFKAWLEGFCDGIGEAPTVDQWRKVRENLDTVQVEIVGTPLPPIYAPPVFVPPTTWAPSWNAHPGWSPNVPLTCDASN